MVRRRGEGKAKERRGKSQYITFQLTDPYLILLQCVTSASIDALVTHWTASNQGRNR